ncbi:MAG: VOC family protein [Spirochaetales bacterium]|nr:VOC family protein [Spirochaetales bacterium]
MDFCWVTLNVRDMDKSLHFYRDIIGLSVERKMQPNPDMEIVFLDAGRTKIELIHNKKAQNISFGEDISLGFTVDSVDGIIEELAKNNIPVHSGPFQPNPNIKFIFVLDPNGVKIQFVENIG